MGEARVLLVIYSCWWSVCAVIYTPYNAPGPSGIDQFPAVNPSHTVMRNKKPSPHPLLIFKEILHLNQYRRDGKRAGISTAKADVCSQYSGRSALS